MPGTKILNPIPDWLEPQNASVFDPVVVKTVRAIAHALGLDDPQNQMLMLMNPMTPKGQEMAGPLSQAVRKVIRAFHGSPHDFEKFSTAKIGTGEGAHAYGHGLYFAEHEGTAKAYRDQVRNMPEVDRINTRLSELAKELEPLRKPGTYREFRDPRGYALADEYDRLMAERSKPGKMYEVEIQADPDTFLDWDAPLSQQPAPVRAALEQKLGIHTDPYKGFRIEPTASGKSFKVLQGNYEYGTYRSRVAAEQRMQELGLSHTDTGEALYGDLRMKANPTYVDAPTWEKAAPVVSQKLKEAGIPGIKYLDQGSRAAGAGTRNYVVFDDALIQIKRKFGLLTPAMIELFRRKADAHGGMVAQEDIDTFRPAGGL